MDNTRFFNVGDDIDTAGDNSRLGKLSPQPFSAVHAVEQLNNDRIFADVGF